MKRIFPRYVYSSIVGFMIVTTTVTPASGGWLLNRLRCHQKEDSCVPAAPVCPTVCEMPVMVDACCGVIETSTPESACCGVVEGEIILDAGAGCVGCEGIFPMADQIIDSIPMMEPSMAPEPTEEIYTAPVEVDEPSSPDVMPPVEPTPAEVPQAAEPLRPAPVAPVPPAPVAPPVAPAPVPPAPPVPAFEEPIAPAPALEENLFDEPAMPEATAPTEPVVPAEPAAPAEPALDDLFGDAPAPAAEPMPEAAPADSLFDEPLPTAPAEAMPAEDLFGEPIAPAADAPLDDLFGEPMLPAEPSAEAFPAENDIFGLPPATEPAEPAAPAKDAFDDLFGENSRVRVWIDNTGDFSTEGRLVEVGDDYIRLLKSNGRTCTVPSSRLCPADASYIAAVVKNYGDVMIAMTAAR